jgi:hypothetical protein
LASSIKPHLFSAQLFVLLVLEIGPPLPINYLN